MTVRNVDDGPPPPASSTRLALARLVSILDLAEARGVPHRTLRRHLAALRDRDVAEGGGDWWIQAGFHTKVSINLSRLHLAHPELFETTITLQGVERMRDKVEQLAENQRADRQRLGAVAARVRNIEATRAPAASSGSPPARLRVAR